MTIDEAIENLKYDVEIDMYIRDIAPQLAEWLEELKSYRASVFSGYMTQKMLKEEYNKAIDDFAEKLKEKSTFLKSIENDYYGYVSEYEIDDLAEQLKAGGKNV